MGELRELRTGRRWDLSAYRAHLLAQRDQRTGRALATKTVDNRVGRLKAWLLALPSVAAQDVADFAARTPGFRSAEWNDFSRYARSRDWDVADAPERPAREQWQR